MISGRMRLRIKEEAELGKQVESSELLWMDLFKMCWEHMSQEDETSALWVLSVEASARGHNCQDFLAKTEARSVRESSTGRVASSLVYVRTEISNADLVLLGMFVWTWEVRGASFYVWTWEVWGVFSYVNLRGHVYYCFTGWFWTRDSAVERMYGKVGGSLHCTCVFEGREPVLFVIRISWIFCVGL